MSPGSSAQRESPTDELFRDLPESIRVVRVDRVRLHAVQRVRRIVHRGNLAILEVETAATLELGRGGGEHRRRGAGFHRLELQRGISLLQELVVFGLEMA